MGGQRLQLGKIRIVEVPISTIYHGGKSSIHPVKDTLRFVRLFLRCWVSTRGGKA